MAESKKVLRDKMKENYLKLISDFLTEKGEEVLRVGSNIIAFPIVHEDGSEDFIRIPIEIPIGSNKGTEPYDGYSMAEEYVLKQKLKAEAAEKAKIAKAKKIERDKKTREAKAEISKKIQEGKREKE